MSLRVILLTSFLAVTAGEASTPFSDSDRREMLDRFNTALTELSMKIAISPDNIPLRSQRGDVFLFLGRFPEAVADYERMIALDSGQDAPHWRLGIAYSLVGECLKSAEQFTKYHTFDGRDRENGIWEFLARARINGIPAAQATMLRYTQFDREPFPALYEMLAGRKTDAELLAELSARDLLSDHKVAFFAHYYIGLNQLLLGNTTSAREHLAKAVQAGWRGSVDENLGYMWQVARVQLEALKAGER